MKTKLFAILLMFCMVSPAVAWQSTFGSIVGSAVDPSPATIAGANITLKNLDDNTSRTAVTDAEGNFQFVNLKPGRYAISASREGFGDFKVPELQLDARQTLRVEVKFELAQIGETVQVSAGDNTINTENGTIAESIKGDKIQQLPLNYRGATTSPLAAIAAMPSVQQDSNGSVSAAGN